MFMNGTHLSLGCPLGASPNPVRGQVTSGKKTARSGIKFMEEYPSSQCSLKYITRFSLK
jgi:hypothetical protein